MSSYIQLAVVGAMCLLQSTSFAHAQFIATLEAGGTSVRDWSSSSYNTAIVNSSLQLTRTYANLEANATYGSYGSGSWVGNGGLYADFYTPQQGLFSGEISLSGFGTLYDDNTSSSQFLGMLRGHLSNAKAGAWIGAGGGINNDGFEKLELLRGEVGAWAQNRVGTLALTVTPTSMGDFDYTDVAGKGSLFFKKMDLSASIGFRDGSGVPSGSGKAWANVTSTFWVFPLVGISASAGSYPYDVAQNYPGAKYVSVSFKLRSAVPRRINNDNNVEHQVIDPDFSVITYRDDLKRLRIRAKGASSVEVTGSFTDWQPRQLTAIDQYGWWELSIPLSSGMHQMNFRIDTGDWSIPQGMGIAEDEFSGKVGVLVVP